METKLVIYEYNDTQVEFDLGSQNLMINATEMGKVFNKNPKDFLKNEQTKSFIKSCLASVNSPSLGIENEEDLVVVKNGVGTWMHRILAIKFAAWLDADFELWIYKTVDYLMFGSIKKLKDDTKVYFNEKIEIQEIETKLQTNQDFIRLQALKQNQKKYLTTKSKTINNALLDF